MLHQEEFTHRPQTEELREVPIVGGQELQEPQENPSWLPKPTSTPTEDNLTTVYDETTDTLYKPLQPQVQKDSYPLSLQKRVMTYTERHKSFNAVQAGRHVDRETLWEESGEAYGNTLHKMIESGTMVLDEEQDTYSIPQVIERNRLEAERKKKAFEKVKVEPREGSSWLRALRYKGRGGFRDGERS